MRRGVRGSPSLGSLVLAMVTGMWGLLPHRAVTLPLPADLSVPSDGIVPSKNLCHWFKERCFCQEWGAYGGRCTGFH